MPISDMAHFIHHNFANTAAKASMQHKVKSQGAGLTNITCSGIVTLFYTFSDPLRPHSSNLSWYFRYNTR